MSKGQEWIAMPHPMKQFARKDHVLGEALIHRATGLRVLESTDTLSDGKRYMHLSISHPDRYPTWEELLMVKDHFLDQEQEMIQVLPRKSQYVNVHENCFHLWYCYDGDIIGQ